MWSRSATKTHPSQSVRSAPPQERPDKIRPDESEALRQNIGLAESLGATVVRVKAERPVEGLIAFAQREGITPSFRAECSLSIGLWSVCRNGDARLLRARTSKPVVHSGVRGRVWARICVWISASAWPFGLVEAVWAVVAVRRWGRVR
jgi:hypothetical protein